MEVLAVLAVAALIGATYRAIARHDRATEPPAYRTGTDATALAVTPPGELTARDLPNRVGLPGRTAMEARRG